MESESLSPYNFQVTTATFNISYNSTEEAIIIEDNMKTQVFSYNFILILTLCNSLLNVFLIKQPESWGLVQTSWGIIGILSFGILIFNFRKKSSERKISITEIAGLKETTFIGRKTYRLKLKNGRSRNLLHLKNHQEIEKLKSFFKDLGIRE